MSAARRARRRAARAARAAPRAPRRGARRWWGSLATGVVVALVVTLAVVASGFDSRETPREDPSVWVVRSAGQYARVNTETAEIDTVRLVESPSGVVQAGGLGLLLTQGDGRAWAIDAAAPRDIRDAGGEEAGGADETGAGGTGAESGGTGTGTGAAQEQALATGAEGSAATTGIRTPDGTRQVIAAGEHVLFHTESGEAYLGRISAAGSVPALEGPTRLDPFAGQAGANGAGGAAPEYLADAAAIDADGRVALFSAAEGAIHWFDAGAGEFRRSTSEVPDGVPAEGVQLSIVGGRWALLDAAGGRLWREGEREPIEFEPGGGALLQGSSAGPRDSAVLVADEGGLWSLGGAGRDDAVRVAEATGAPARPEQVGQDLVAAWIGSTSAALWTSSGGEAPLDLDETVEDLSDPDPVIRTSGGRGLVTDVRSGMMWTVPDGRLIPVEQWELVDPPRQDAGTVVAQDVTEQEPPVAVDDSFGVRAGEPAPLPVLLNDHDPNRKDVLTIVPDGIGGDLSASSGSGGDFGAVELLSDGQGLVVRPSPAAVGSASFTYRVTDGLSVSAPATVTLTVMPETVSTAPQWCPVEGCQRSWPAPELVPGGTLVLPVLEGWVDPEGDPMLLTEASPVDPEDPVRAIVTADGRLAIRHTDPNAAAGDVAIAVRVADSRGESTERELRVRVRPGAGAEFAPIAATVRTGETTTVRPLERVTGGSGSFALVDAVVQTGAASLSVRQGAGTIELSAETAGGSLIAVTVRDTVTELEISGVIRVTAVEERSALAVPPLRAFVRPLGDTTIEVLDAIPGAGSRSLVVQSAAVVDGALRVDVIEHARIRVSGSTSDGLPGRVGAVDVVIAEGGAVATGRITVFQVPETSGGAIAAPDAVSVRAGSVVDIAVLENDVAPPGERLVLHPEIGAPGAEGELAFASGGRVRYLAPPAPGVYTLSYTISGASSPEQSDVGQVRVTVLPTGSNRDPEPPEITVRVAPGERVAVSIPVSRADPDGDRVRLVAVDAPTDPQLSAAILPRTGTVQVAASTAAARGTQYAGYTVRDEFGGEATGRLRIVVTDPDPGGGAPVVYSDYVRIARGTAEPVAVRPLDNDLDPSGGVLEIVGVVPNLPGGEADPRFAELAARLDLSDKDQGVVRIAGGEELGAVSFIYTVRSSRSMSTADGLIVVRVSDRIGRQAPTVQDTVLSVRDRAELQSGGVDVVTGRVQWVTGDVSELELSLWGASAERYRVSGSSIVGSYRAEGDLVTFRLAGTDASGSEVETFGFLVVPPLDELRLTLKPGARALSVNEGGSVDADLRDLLDLGPGDRIDLAPGPFPVQRAQAECEARGATGIRYTAGREAPWRDSCTVRVRLVEQRSYTVLPIPIDVVPDAPVALLNPLTRTIAPGEAETIDLSDMVEWQGGRAGDLGQLRWQVGGSSAPFEVTAAGSRVQVRVRADGVPGAQQALAIAVSGAGESRAALTLRVGTAAQDAPRGGTVSLRCTVGSACRAPLVGVAGEHDPFAGKSGGGLHLVSVDGAGCRLGALEASGDGVAVSWPDQRGPGGRCTAGFTVRDAQNRTGTGTIEFDAQGVPRAPASIAAVAYTESSVTLEVQLGEASNAHPELTGITLQQDGAASSAACEPVGVLYRCLVTGLGVGEPHTFRAIARNSVGDSDPTNAVETWAFRQPRLESGDIDVKQSQSSGATTAATGTLRFTVSSSDDTISGYRVIAGGQTGTIVGRSGSTSIPNVPVGPATAYTVVPISRYQPPGGGANEGAAVSGNTAVAGLPLIQGVSMASAQDSRDIAVAFTVNGNGDSALRWGAAGGSGGCSPENPGGGAPNFDVSTTVTAPQLRQVYPVTVCARNAYGQAEPVTRQVWVGGDPPSLALGAYTVSAMPAPHGAGVVYGLESPPAVSGQEGGATVRFSPGGGSLALDPAQVLPVTAVQCAGPNLEHCSAPSNAAAWVNAPTTVTVAPSGACYSADAPPADLRALLTVSEPARAWVTSVSAGTPSGGTIPIVVGWAGSSHNGQAIALADATIHVCYAPPGSGP